MAEDKRTKRDPGADLLDSIRSGVGGDEKQDDSKLQLQHFTLTSSGLERNYYVHVPPTYTGKTAMPLVFAFHGAASKPRIMPRLTGLSKCADKHSFILVYPEGLKQVWLDGRAGKSASELRDVKFVADMLDKIEKDFKVDPKRVYACGISNGGFFSQYLCMNLPDKFAAAASVAASMEQTTFKNAKVTKPVPLLFIMGDDDQIVPFEGGSLGMAGMNDIHPGTVVPAQQAVDFWVKGNQCNEKPATANLPDAHPEDGTHVVRKTYSGGKNGSEVVFFIVKNGGHTWPSGWQYLPDALVGLTSKAISANEEIWTFFQRHHL